ncbi:MAG: lipoyl(octanoyl) transferase LipB [Myxococcota bacterium]
MTRELEVDWLGTVPYADALELQKETVDARRAGAGCDKLLLLEHPPVVTIGRGATAENLLVDPAELERRGVEFHRVSRGGDVTYHGPGQLVGYLIIDLAARDERDVHRFLRKIEAATCSALDELGIPSHILDGYTGVFVGDSGDVPEAPAALREARPRKIASIGVGIRSWVTYHGFALNVDIDLTGFEAIVPCGLDFVEMTSVERELRVGGTGDSGLGERVRNSMARACAEQWPAKAAK